MTNRFIDYTERAEMFAVWHHLKAGQSYGLMPYYYHCTEVAMIARAYVPTKWYNTEFWDPEEQMMKAEQVICAAWCHDLVEDCGLSYNDILAVIGRTAADIVFCVTNEQGKNRKERHEKTHPKIAANRTAVFVKLCDRLANRLNAGKGDMYDREYQEFREIFYVAGEYDDLWKELDQAHSFQAKAPVTAAVVDKS